MEREDKNTNKKRRSVQKKRKKYIDIKIPTVYSRDTNLQVELIKA